MEKRYKKSATDYDTTKDPMSSAWEYYDLFENSNVSPTDEDIMNLFSKKNKKRKKKNKRGV